MKVTLPDFHRAGVLVVGDVMLDRYWYGPTNRISPEAPVPVVKVNTIEERPGGAANVAMNISSLGASSRLIGLTGVDDAARALGERLAEVKVHCDFVALPTHPTITKLRILSRNQQLIRLDFEEGFEGVDLQPMLTKIEQALPESGALVLSDYAKGALTEVQKMIQLARKAGVPVLVDPKGSDFERYRGATLLTPNLSEFEAVVGRCKNEDELVARGMQLIADFELSALLVTRSEHGMTLLQPGKEPLHLPTQAQEVYDVTGAGDTVISTLAAAIAAGEELPHAVALANLAAGIVVGKLGTAAISAPELRRAIQRSEGSERGVVTLDQLLLAIDDARAHNEKIVFTNGCFDILHAGHVTYLEQARAQGDRLIVAVNDDASVSRLKGPGRPINSVDRRMAVLAGLGAVDWVISFPEATPENLLVQLKPDVLVKGGDYGIDQVVGADIVTANGGVVKVLGLVENSSTTAIVEKIRGQ